MIIDGLKPLISKTRPENVDFNPVKSVVETFFRTVIIFKDKAVVIESNDDFTLELVDNTGNSWKTLEFSTYSNKKDLFLAIERIILDRYKENKPTIKKEDLSTKQKVLLRQEKILKCIENKPFITIPEIVELLNSDYQEIARSIQILKNKNKITEYKNNLQKSYQIM